MTTPSKIEASTLVEGETKATHTPGPWQRIDNADYAEIHPMSGRRLSAIALVGKAEDANLVAAAPDMLAALQEIADRHIPDQPAAVGGDELSWAQRQHGGSPFYRPRRHRQGSRPMTALRTDPSTMDGRLKPAKGILVGLAISLALWAAIGAAVWSALT